MLKSLQELYRSGPNEDLDTALEFLLNNDRVDPEKKILADLLSAQTSLNTLTNDRDQPIVSRRDNYWTCFTYFFLASAALWAGETAYGSFQFDSSSGGLQDLSVPFAAAAILGAFFALGDWINNIATVSPTNDSDGLALSNSGNSSTLLESVGQVLWYPLQNPTKFFSIDVPFFVSYFVGASAGFDSALPYILSMCSNPEPGTPEYYAAVGFTALLTIVTGIVYYYCYNSRPLDKTKAAYALFKAKSWVECDLNLFRIFEALFDCIAVLLYRSIGFAAIVIEFLGVLGIPISGAPKLAVAMAVFSCTADNVILTRCLKTAAPYFDYAFAGLTAEQKQDAFNKLSFSDVYWNLNILSGLLTSSGIALVTYLYASKDRNVALPLAIVFGLAKLYVSVMAQRDLASCQKARVESPQQEDEDPQGDRVAIAKKAFTALANTFKQDTWLVTLSVASCLLGRGARLTSFAHFNKLVSGLFGVDFSAEALIAVLLIVGMANARNEFKMFFDGMMEVLPQKIAEAYVQHCTESVNKSPNQRRSSYFSGEAGHGYVALREVPEDDVEVGSHGQEATTRAVEQKQSSFNSICVIYPWKLSLYKKGMIDAAPEDIAFALEKRVTEINQTLEL